MFSRFIHGTLRLPGLLFIVIVFSGCASTRSVTSKADTQTLENLKTHISYLASDQLEGRRTGTAGERMAMMYIMAEFQKAGLEPKGTDGYFQPFEVYDGKKIGPATRFSINQQPLQVEKDFFPLPFSAEISQESIPSLALLEPEMPWFVDLKDALEDNKKNPHFVLTEYIRTHAQKAKDRGATAVILYNTSDAGDPLSFDPKDKSPALEIPVIYITKSAMAPFLKDPTASLRISYHVELLEQKRTGHNVVGLLNNNAPVTIILGAHYDHLGYGEDGNSRHTAHEPDIHNGADDNASGTAALMELAKKLSTASKKANYLFIAFSGEELGLYGSKYFTQHPTVDLSTASFMINMDMVGRLNDSSKAITVGGYGTSPDWEKIIYTGRKIPFEIKIDSSGTGPSDHTSFYRKDIPVLFFFTGLHTDYHKPGDDAEKINYAGTLEIVDFIHSIIQTASVYDRKLTFAKTREAQTTTSARFSVSMGIMPDYTFSGPGVKVDGVSEGKPAQAAGIMAGDIIVQLGDFPVSSMEQYMQALGKFKKGDRTRVKFKRGTEAMESPIEF